MAIKVPLCYLCDLLLDASTFSSWDGFCPTTSGNLTLVNISPWQTSDERTRLKLLCERPAE
ncbi:MAG TPA: hypothetical protein VFZ59_22330 [Verrucomicrobiae bacterium]|nr:hypothetical protein [Verrucomicrobiae bacterium]